MKTLILFVACVCAVPWPARAQAPADERPRIRLGPVGLTPSVALTNLGVDTNVFNDFEDPKRDFTFTVTPQVDAVLRVRRARLQVSSRSNLIYFQQYSSERSADTDLQARLEFRGARLTPWVAAGIASGRQRYGYEVDLRVRRTIDNAGGGVELRLAGRTRIIAGLQRTRISYDEGIVSENGSLREALNLDSQAGTLEVRYSMTPLTTFVVASQVGRDRFEFTPSRDTDSVRVDAGFDLESRALISGRGRLGYRRFDGVGGGLPSYSGLVASVSAGTTVKGRTRLDVQSTRDVNYSWEFAYPYYVQTGVTLTATPRLTERWDVQGRIGLQRLAYRAAIGLPGLLGDRVDSYGLGGGGVGIRLGREMRLGVNLDRERRESPVRRREYIGYRTGVSVTYGR